MIKGIITPTITVFDDQRNIDFNAFGRHIENLIKGGVNGILFLGSIGEFFAITVEEKKEIISFAIETVAGRVPVLIGSGGTVVEDVIELSNYVAQKGADGVAVITPYFFQFNQETLYKYYSLIAEVVESDIYIYNFPARSGVNISPKTVYKLAKKYSNIVGIKDTMDTISHTRELIQKVKIPLERDFAVYSGFDEYFLPNLMNGGDGLIGGLSNIVPELFVEFYQAYLNNNFIKLEEFSKKINRLMSIYSVSEPFFPAIKKSTSLRNFEFNSICKSPVKDLDKEQIDQITLILNDLD